MRDAASGGNDRLNPTEHLSDDEFLARYRFIPKSAMGPLPLDAIARNRALPLPPMLQLLIGMRFYGTGTFQVVTGDLINASEFTVCRVVDRISRRLARTLFSDLV